MVTKPTTVEEYLMAYPAEVQLVLRDVRRAILAAVPEVEEAIAYGMPTYRLDGRALVHFAGWTSYVSVYPMPALDDAALEAELAPYRATRGTGRFPLAKPIPYDLIERLVRALAQARD